jgi:hypothetical protein
VAYRREMLYAFGFERVAVVAGDLYIVDPDPLPGQGGPEQGVRLEVRLLERRPLQGGIYSAQPIAVDRPIWRADLLETVDHPGSFDRAHHHPRFVGWDPVRRVFEPDLSADPVGWVGTRLSDLDGLLGAAAVDPDEVGATDADAVGATDADAVRAAVPEILDAVRRLLHLVRSREPAASGDDGVAARISWL